MNIFNEIAKRIIQEQELVIGPLAWIEARKVAGISILEDNTVEIIDQDKAVAIDKLVEQYQKLFGSASKEVSRLAVTDLLPRLVNEKMPASLA